MIGNVIIDVVINIKKGLEMRNKCYNCQNG